MATAGLRTRTPMTGIVLAVVAGAFGAGVVLLGPAAGDLNSSIADQTILALATLAMGIVLMAAILRPWSGLLVWLVCMPLLNVARVRIDTEPVAVTASTIVLLALVVGWLMESRRYALAPGSTIRPAILQAAAILALVTVASVLVHGDPATSWPVALHGVLEPLAAVLLVIELRPTRRQLWQLVAALVASAGIAAAYSLYRLTRTALLSGLDQVSRGDFGHYVFYNVNIFGEVLAMATPLAIGLFLLTRGHRPWRVGSFVLVTMFVLAIYFTFSKGAWLGGLAGIALVATLASKRPWQRATSISAAVLVGFLIVPVPLYVGSWLGSVGIGPVATASPTPGPTSSGSPRPSPSVSSTPSPGSYQQILEVFQGPDRLSSWDPTSASGEVSVRERFFAWKAALEMAVSSPVVGVGPGRFGEEVRGAFRQAGSIRPLNSAHNYVLNIAAELGVIAAMLVLFGIITGARFGFRAWRRGPAEHRILGLVVMGGLAGFVMIGQTTGADLYEPYRVMNSDGLFLALLIGLAFALAQLRATSEPELIRAA